MNCSRTLFASILISLSAWTGLEGMPVARACSAPACWSPSVFPSGGIVPANQFRLRYRPGADYRPEAGDAREKAQLFSVTGGARSELMAMVTPEEEGRVSVLSLADMPAPGTTIVLEAAAPPTCTPPQIVMPLRAEFTITAPSPVPDSLGQLSAAVKHQRLQVATRAGSCSVEVEAAYADLKLALADNAKPFVDVIDYELLLDGAPFPAFSDSLVGSKTLPRGEERVYTPCDGDEHLIDPIAPGMHRAKFRGTLPDGSTVESGETQFELWCPPVPQTPATTPTPSASQTTGAAGAVAPATPAAGAVAPTGPAGGAVAPTAPAAGSASEAAPPEASVQSPPSASAEATSANDAGTLTSSVQAPPSTLAESTNANGCSVAQRIGSQAIPSWLLTVATLLCSLVVARRQAGSSGR